MDVVLDARREIIVYHSTHLLHIETTCSNVSRNHDRRATILEFTQNPITLSLTLITMDSKSGPSISTELSAQIITPPLRFCEDEKTPNISLLFGNAEVLFQDLCRFRCFVKVVTALDDLGNVVIGLQIRGTNVDLDRIFFKIIPCHSLDLLRPSGSEHQRLPIWSNLSKDLLDLGLKTHIEHTISLIEHEVSYTPEIGMSCFKHIDQTTWSSNADFDTSIKITDLRALWNTAIDAGILDLGRRTKFITFLLYLHSKLTGRRQYKDNWAVTTLKVRLRINVHNRGKNVGKGFSRPCISYTNNVTASKSHRPRLTLNRSRVLEASTIDPIHDILRERSLLKGRYWLWHVTSHYCNVSCSPELIDLLRSTTRHIGVFMVKILFKSDQSVQHFRCPPDILKATTRSAELVSVSSSATAVA
mmetsp:Transcript_43578/g.113496  ORF Transcript_43578/g.113496 Transcript_43578/m.113496 type:complete len:416 (-) Transcript_43578:251-1498(-)